MAAAIEGGKLRGSLAGVLLWMIGPLAMSVDYAGDVFSLEIWKLNIPIDDDGDGFADEVVMPVLRNFEDPAFFHLSATKDSIVFRAPGAGAEIGKPGFLSCHLRELEKKSKAPASWGSNDGLVHNMTISFAFNALPAASTGVIAAGIYDGEEAVISIRLENENVLLTREGLDPIVLSRGYKPGDWLDLMIIIDRGRVRVLKSVKEIAEWPLEKTAVHLRAGCVVVPEPGPVSEAGGFGEVEIRKLFVTHQPQ